MIKCAQNKVKNIATESARSLATLGLPTTEIPAGLQVT
jgi:hypothetical protein